MIKKNATLPHRLEHLDDFLLNLQSNNYSDETIYNYERDIKIFESFLNQADIPFSEVNKLAINQYKAYLNSIDRRTAEDKKSEIKLKSLSLNRLLSSLRSYLKFLIETDLPCPISPESVKLVRTERKHPQVAELRDLVKLVESPSYFENNKIVAARNRAMLEVLFSTGMRISELTNLNQQQIDHSGRIFIRGKGKKERFVYLTPRAYKYLKDYLTTGF